MANLSFWDKYTDAFWRLVPIPTLVIMGAITVAPHPSLIAVVALLLLTVVGGVTEALIWRRLRLRWTDLSPDEAGTLFEPNSQRELALATILLSLRLWPRPLLLGEE